MPNAGSWSPGCRTSAASNEAPAPTSPIGSSLVDRLAADATVTRTEADLRWLDLCEERLRTTRPAPTRQTKQEDS